MYKFELKKLDKAIKNLQEISSENYDEISCWVKEEKNYDIYIFSVIVESEEKLSSVWEVVTSDIASYFQSELEKDIEIWNIYIVFVCPKAVSKELKDLVEQNKYSSRKLVLNEVSVRDEKDLKCILINKLFDLQIERKDQGDSTDNDYLNYIELIEKHNNKLYNLLSQNYDDLFETYLEVLKNECEIKKNRN